MEERKKKMAKLETEIKNLQQNLKPKEDDFPNPDECGFDIYGGMNPLNGLAGGDLLMIFNYRSMFDFKTRIKDAKNKGNLESVINTKDVRSLFRRIKSSDYKSLLRLFHENYSILKKVVTVAEMQEVGNNLVETEKRNAIVLVDISGHDISDVFLTADVRAAVRMGLQYDLTDYGEMTLRLFDELSRICYKFFQGKNNGLDNNTPTNKYLVMSAGETTSKSTFRYFVAGQQKPVFFSPWHKKFVTVHDEYVSHKLGSFPIGMVTDERDPDSKMYKPSPIKRDGFTVYETRPLHAGEIILMFSDGLYDREGGLIQYYTPMSKEKSQLEEDLDNLKHLNAKEIYNGLLRKANKFAPTKDDVSLAVIKKV